MKDTDIRIKTLHLWKRKNKESTSSCDDLLHFTLYKEIAQLYILSASHHECALRLRFSAHKEITLRGSHSNNNPILICLFHLNYLLCFVEKKNPLPFSFIKNTLMSNWRIKLPRKTTRSAAEARTDNGSAGKTINVHF